MLQMIFQSPLIFSGEFHEFYLHLLNSETASVKIIYFLAFLIPPAAGFGAAFLSPVFLSPAFLSVDFLPSFLGAGAAALAVGLATTLAGRGAFTVVACAALRTLTTFCSSIRKARMIRSRKHLWQRTPPNERETVLRRRAIRGRSLGRDGVIPFNFSLH